MLKRESFIDQCGYPGNYIIRWTSGWQVISPSDAIDGVITIKFNQNGQPITQQLKVKNGVIILPEE